MEQRARNGPRSPLYGPFLVPQDLLNHPVLLLTERPRLPDPDDITHLAAVILVMSLKLGGFPHRLAVQRMSLHRLHRHNDGLVHLVADYSTFPALPPTGDPDVHLIVSHCSPLSPTPTAAPESSGGRYPDEQP